MYLPFLDRSEERERLRRSLTGAAEGLVVLYGRRRCGKSRLLSEVLADLPGTYYVADEREASLQRRSMARAMAAVIPQFDQAEYPEWDALLGRWWREAPRGSILALDEFQYLAAVSPELPSVLQKELDRAHGRRLRLVLCGSSQRMMRGLALDAAAPLYGRAREILKIEPLPPGWIRKALGLRTAREALAAYAVWGGIPRYWELAAECGSTREAIRRLILDPAGVLRDEPARLLLDDIGEIAQASSILSLIGEGCHKMSEVAGRLGKPATSLSRPLARLMELGLIKRELPFDSPERDAKRSIYRLEDRFLDFWYRFVSPRRALLDTRRWQVVDRDFDSFFPGYLGETWENLARRSVPHIRIARRAWRPASRWWGAGADRQPLEIDVAALSEDESCVLIGEAKLTVQRQAWKGTLDALARKIERFPLARGREIVPCVFYADGDRPPAGHACVTAAEVFDVLV